MDKEPDQQDPAGDKEKEGTQRVKKKKPINKKKK